MPITTMSARNDVAALEPHPGDPPARPDDARDARRHAEVDPVLAVQFGEDRTCGVADRGVERDGLDGRAP